ncbi:MAG: hypothetical protein EHM61_28445, partial [Acidobacteria bacterium]
MRRLTTLLIVFALTFGLAAAAKLEADAVRIAREVDGPYTLAGPSAKFTQSVIRGVGNNFFVRVDLTGGNFNGSSTEPTPAPVLSYDGTATDVSITGLGDISDGDFDADRTFAEWHVRIWVASTTYPSFHINFTNCSLDATGIAAGDSVTATVQTRDANTNEPFDLPAVSDVIATGVWAFLGARTADTATINVVEDRKEFVPENESAPGPGDDTATEDKGARIDAEINNEDDPIYDQDGDAIGPTWPTTDVNVEVMFTG